MGQQLTISCKLLMPVSTSWLPKRCILLTTHLPVHVVYLYIYIDIYMKITYTFKLCVIRKTFAFCFIYIYMFVKPNCILPQNLLRLRSNSRPDLIIIQDQPRMHTLGLYPRLKLHVGFNLRQILRHFRQ